MLYPKDRQKAMQQLKDMRQRANQKAMAKRVTPDQLKKQNESKLRTLKKMKEKKAIKKLVTDPYFDFWMEHTEYECENCGAKIDYIDRRACQAHILPKRDNMFPSIAGELGNHATLGVRCGCHPNYDNKGWEYAATMPIFPTLKERFKLFEHKIAPEERHRIPAVFTT